MANIDLLIAAGIVNANNLPNSTDVATINGLKQADVQGLINVFNGVTSSFLSSNCNQGNPTGPSQGVRTIGIVFWRRGSGAALNRLRTIAQAQRA